jgi:hypothetical protein
MYDASKAAISAWAQHRYADVVSLLTPFTASLTAEEYAMLEAAKSRHLLL